MNEDSGGKKRKSGEVADAPPTKMAASFIKSKRGLFKDYVHMYTDDRKEYPILISSINVNTSIDILKANKVLKSCTGLIYVKPVGKFMLKAVFSNKQDANAFLLGKSLLSKQEWQAKIPYNHIESQGIIKAHKDISEEDLLTNLKTDCEVIGVKRFLRKVPDGSLIPTPTVLLTFLSSSRPEHVKYDYIRLDVKEYIQPVRQCFVCYKFGHSRGSCRSQQICSICSGNHFFKDCKNKDNINCINCNGSHIAISNSCPIKAAKNQEIKDKITGKKTYAAVAAKVQVSNVSTPSSEQSSPNTGHTAPKNLKLLNMPQKRLLFSDILNSDDVINVLTKTLVDINRKGSQTGVSSKLIKELLISNFAT